MALQIYLAQLKWDGIAGATGYEISVDGKVVATAGARARTTKVSVDESTKVAVLDLPNRTVSQEINLTQEDAT